MTTWWRRHPLAVAMIAALLAQLAYALTGAAPILSGEMIDSDCYSRLARVLQLHLSGLWWDGVDHRIDAPWGETLQWTRPLDVLLLLGAEPLGLVMPFERALWLWGALISPVLLLITLAVLWWGVGKRLGAGGFLVMVGLLHASPALITAFVVGRPDHHSLLALLFASQLMLLLRTQDGARWCWRLGLAGAAAMWVSLESLVPQLFFGGALAGLWLVGRLPARSVAAYAAGLAVLTAVALSIEFPPSLWLIPAYDRISVVHLTLLSLTALLWFKLSVLERPRWSWGHRLAAMLPAVAVLAAVVLLGFPKLLAGPFVDRGEEARLWLTEVAEWQPMWPDSRQHLADLVRQLGSVLVVVPWLLLRRRRDAPWAVIWLAGIPLFVGVALSAVRWASYPQLLLLLPWTEAVLAIAANKRLPASIAVATIAATLCSLLALPLTPAKAKVAENAPARCRLPEVARALDRTLPADDIILSYLFVGPELEWRTRLRVVGIPSANPRTLRDTRAVFDATDDASARAVLTKRGVGWLLLCPNNDWAGDHPGGLHHRLATGQPPGWLVEAPIDAAGARLFRVIPEETAQ